MPINPKKVYDPDTKSGLTMKKTAGEDDMWNAIRILTEAEVLIGFPEETSERPPEENGLPSPVTNAVLGYIHDNGAPEVKIPARPFMIPGITNVLPAATEILGKAAQYALHGDKYKVREGYERIGLMGVSAIRSVIRAGIPPALADVTVKKRAAKGRKGAQAELNRRALGYGASLQLATPLMDTGEMLKSVSYVVRNRALRKK